MKVIAPGYINLYGRARIASWWEQLFILHVAVVYLA
jgi:hypothetical protein